MIQVGSVPDLSSRTSRTERTTPVTEVPPTFSVLLVPLNWAMRHRLASFRTFVLSVCTGRYPSRCPDSANCLKRAITGLRVTPVVLLVGVQEGTRRSPGLRPRAPNPP